MSKKRRILSIIVCAVILFTSYGHYFEVKAVTGTSLATTINNLYNGLADKVNNTTIYPNSGDYYLQNGETVNLVKEMAVTGNKTIKINGYGTILNQTSPVQNMFEIVDGSRLEIIGESTSRPITIDVNNSAWTAIWSKGDLYLENVVIKNAINTGTGNYGGAISCNVTSDSLTMKNVTITNCKTPNGAAINIYPNNLQTRKNPTTQADETYYPEPNNAFTAQLDNVQIVDCSSPAAGSKGVALNIQGGGQKMDITLNNVRVSNCYADWSAAIYYAPTITNSSLTIKNSKFENCKSVRKNAEGAGIGSGIIYINESATKVTIENTVFNNNNVTEFGTLYVNGTAPLNMSLTNVTFSVSTGVTGAAIFYINKNAASTMNITDSNFIGCVAESSGGALYVSDTSGNRSKITMNRCYVNQCKSRNGSAIGFGEGCVTFTLKNSVIENCESITTGDGEGGTFRTGGTTRAEAYITNCVFRNNFSRGNGGAIYWNANGVGANLDILDCQFLGNWTPMTSVNNRGGALFLEGTKISVKGTAGEMTPAMYTGTTVPEGYIKGTLIEGNSSRVGGGVSFKTVESMPEQYIRGTDTSLDSNIVIRNNKAQYGGGIGFELTRPKIESGAKFNLIINGPKIMNNTATNGGGGIYMNKENDTPADCYMYLKFQSGTISNNTVTNGDGGAMSIKQGHAEIGIVNCPVDTHIHPVMNNNTASGKGGGIHITGGSAEMYCGFVIDNTATGYQESNNFYQSGTSTHFIISGGTFGTGVKADGNTQFDDRRTGQDKEIIITYHKYISGEESEFIKSYKVVLVGSLMYLPTEDDLPTDFKRDGYAISGWSTVPGATEGNLDAGTSVIITSSIDYYTVWTKSESTITTSTGKGTVSSDAYSPNNNGYNYNIPYTDKVSDKPDGVRDSAYDNALVIPQNPNAKTTANYLINGKAIHSEADFRVLNNGKGLCIYVEVKDDSLQIDGYPNYVNHTKGDFVEFFIDFPNDHEELVSKGTLFITDNVGDPNTDSDGVSYTDVKYYRDYTGRGGDNQGCAGWMTVGPPSNNKVVSGGLSGAFGDQIKVAQKWLGSDENPTGYIIEVFIPFPTTADGITAAEQKFNTERIGIGYETYNVSDLAGYNAATTVNELNKYQSILASGTKVTRYYRWYNELPDYYLTPDTSVDSTSSHTYEYSIDESYQTISTPFYKEHIFNGWKVATSDGNWTATDAASVLDLTRKYGNVTLTAQWQTRSDTTYSVVYNLNGGKNHASNRYTLESGDANLTLQNPTRNGYDFTEWVDVHTGNAITTLSPTKNYALYAGWTPKSYSIEFNLNQGTIGNGVSATQSYNIETPFKLPAVTRSGYLFYGWIVTGVESDGNWVKGETFTEVPVGKYGNVDVAAMWIEEYPDLELSVDAEEEGRIIFIEGTPFKAGLSKVTLKIVVKKGQTKKVIIPAGEYKIYTKSADNWRYDKDELNLYLTSNTGYTIECNKIKNKWLNAHGYDPD